MILANLSLNLQLLYSLNQAFKMKKILFFLLILSAAKALGQNKQVLYDFAELPQTLLLNPGAETNYKFHTGVPLLSGLSMDFGSSGAVLTDVFALDNKNINDKIATVLKALTTRDFLKINTQVEVLNLGFRVDDKTYFSFGFYEEIDAIGYYPKDGITMFYEGNDAYLNKSFSLGQLLYKLDAVGVIHAGISKKVNDNLTLGGRFKVYSSAVNIESANNSGTFTTVRGTDNSYKHYLSNININTKSSGLYIKDSETDTYVIQDAGTIFGNTLLGGNLGIGIDFGVTYHITPQLKFSGSILDFGFINHKKNTLNLKAKGSFVSEGIGFEYNPDNPSNYWGQIEGDFKEQVPIDTNKRSYISWRPTKLNAALKYRFKEIRRYNNRNSTFKDFYSDAIGVQLYYVFRPLNPQLALTGFYQKAITKNFQTKVTYTVDDFSNTNIGAGFSAQFGIVNLYGMLDNLLEYSNLSAANSLSLQVGINIIIN
jgi:hypothetical protein